MTALTINHRRDRQQTRRMLADLRIRYRDIAGSSFQEVDPINTQPRRLIVFPNGARH